MRRAAFGLRGVRTMRWGLSCLVALLVCASAAAQEHRFLAKADILLYGIALKVEPAEQTVPKNIATIVSTFLQSSTTTGEGLPPFAPDAVVMATLRGPSFAKPLELTTTPNTPFNIPPLTLAGLHTLEDIRLVSNGQVLLRGTPESVTINVIDKLLVTQITARPLTAAEIREKGIVFDKSNFQAYNFTAAFAIQNGASINLNFPVLLPTLQGAADQKPSVTDIPSIQLPAVKTLSTIVPDTLKIQTQVPNLSVVGFTLNVPSAQGQNLIVPPIPGVIVIPGNIGFLDQFFSVLLMVSNAAPAGSNLVVSDLSATIVLPPGNDGVVGSGDDPLAMAKTANGVSPSVRPITQPGQDSQLGTADDITTIGPGETGNAEFLVEGRREGSHTVEMAIAGTLNGLPGGPVAITGRAVGAVLVRNPTFSLTFVHPDTVTAGEQYTLDVTVTNTSNSPANAVSVNLFPRNISGATLVGDASKSIDSIAPGDAASVSFELISAVTGTVTAATLDSDAQVAGRFELKHSVGELGVPLSPESLVLPAEASALPKPLRDAAVALLGKAWAVATAPNGSLPKDVLPFSRQIVIDRGVSVAEAGLRVSLQEAVRDSVTQLAMDFAGSDFGRLAALNPNPDDFKFASDNYTGFDDLRRRSTRGDVFANAVAGVLAPDFGSMGASAFHTDVARKLSYRPPHISVAVGTSGAPLPFSLSILDTQHRQVGGADDAGKVLKQIPFSDYLIFNSANSATGEMAFLAAPAPGDYIARLDPVVGVPPDTPFTLTVVVPRADGTLRQLVFDNLTSRSAPQAAFAAGDPYRLTVSMQGPADQPVAPSQDSVIQTPPPSVVAVVQKADADLLPCINLQAGRVISVLFSAEVTPQSAQDKFNAADITNYSIDGNKVVSVALQPGGRIALLALRDPIGPFVPRQITISGIADTAGRVMDPQTLPITTTVTDAAGVVSGRVLQADGTPVPFAAVNLFTYSGCPDEPWSGISSKAADAQGNFGWDFVLRDLERIVATDPESGEFRDVQFNVQRDGQRVNVDVVLLGRGTVQGRTLDESGKPLKLTSVRITSLTDQSQYGATSDANGAYVVSRVPVGNVLIEAVNTSANAKTFVSDVIPFAGATTTRDLALISQTAPQVVVQHGTLNGHVLRADGATAVSGVPVIVYYTGGSQAGVICPNAAPECAVALANTDDSGSFSFTNVVAGALRIQTFDQPSLQQGEVKTPLAPDATLAVNILLSAGLGTVHGTVLDALGKAVANARVGGALSLTTTDAQGAFTLTDVPVGHATLVAVSDALQTSGQADVDIVRAGEDVSVTIVLAPVGGFAGTVRLADGTTPAKGIRTYLFKLQNGSAFVVGATITDDAGHYAFSKVPVSDFYYVSAFRADFSDGNVVPTSLRFANEVVKADVTFRGGGGRVVGTLLDSNGVTPLAGKVGISGDQPVIAGGQVVVAFAHAQNFAIVDTSLTSGTFEFGGLFVGPFTLSAAGQFSPDPVALEGSMPTPGATVQMDVKLQPGSQITGVILQPDGVNPVGANVVVKYKSDAFKSICAEGSDGEPACTSIPQGIQEEVAVTDQNGRFALPLVTGGTFTITAEDQASGKSGQIHGTVKAGDTADLIVRLSGVGTIAVQVLGSDALTPIPGAKVVVTQIDYPRKSLTRFADAQGSVTLGGADGFSEGQFTVQATDVRNGFSGRAAGRVDSDGQQVAVKVFLFNQSGTVHGTVFKSDGLTPVSNAEVVVTGTTQLPLAFALTADDGTYSVDQIPLGPFAVDVFDAATGRRGFANARVDTDRQVVAVDVVEASLGVVRGTALDAKTLDVLKGWTIQLLEVLPSGRSQALQGMSSVDGTFSFPGVSLGSVTLFASKQAVAGTGQTKGAITHEGQLLDLPLLVNIVRPLKGTIAGRVFNPDGSPAANSIVQVGSVASLVADAGGTFSTEQPLGRYVIQARAQTSANSGSALVQLSNDGETVGVTVTLIGLSRIDGHVQHNDGSSAPNVQLKLTGVPSAGCPAIDGLSTCTNFTDANGDFSFVDVPATSFSISATEAVSGLRGSIGDTLDPGSIKNVRIVLQPSGSLRARVLTQNGGAASGVVAQVVVAGQRLFLSTDTSGQFAFDTLPLGVYSLEIDDPLGGGIAKRSGTIAGDVDLGNVALDETPPSVATVTPAASATGVPLAQTVHIVFTEKVDASTVNGTDITISDGTNAIAGTLLLESGDASVLFTPIAPLKESTRYTVRVANVKDLVGKPMASAFVATFTTVDLTPPTFVEISPVPGANGVTVLTTVRVKFSEPIDPLKFVGAPTMLSSAGIAVDGRVDYLFGNTVLVFTPTHPLDAAASYRVQIGRAADLSGNQQPTALDYQFSTTDFTPPQLARLIAPPTVVENGTASVIADTGASIDVAFVDFFINGSPAATSRTAPFTLTFQAIPAFGKPGDQIKVSAFATDTSGNRATVETATVLTVTPDVPPTVVITSPASGTTAGNGDLVTVSVHGTDDLGITKEGYKAQTGKPQDAALVTLAQSSLDHTETFSFHVPADAAPGSTILIEASALDTKGQVGQAAPVSITVLDSVPPVVTITGASTGQTVRPGQTTSVVVSAQDLGGVATINFSSSGAAVFTDSRALDGAPTNALASFSVQVPSNALPGDTVTLNASAVDKAGNKGLAASVSLPVADTVPPTLQIHTDNGASFIVPGRSFTVVADASDGIGVARVELTGTGAFTVSEVKQVSPPTGDAHVSFVINVPAGTVAGAVLNLQARAFDTSNNASTPAFLSLTAKTLVDVVLPSSAIVLAGQSFDVPVQVPGGPPNSQTVTFTTSNAGVATVTPSLVFGVGESSKNISIGGQAGGNATISALVQGVERASMTVTVQGGVVDGTVFDSSFAPVAGAVVTVTGVSSASGSSTTDAAGHYVVTGIAGPSVSVHAVASSGTLRGFTAATMNAANGFAHVNLVLMPAGTIHGTVRQADGQTAAPAGVKVDLFLSSALNSSLATTFTDASGAFEFPVVNADTYTIDATAADGNRGRTTVTVLTGADVPATVTYLGRGSVFGTIVDAGGVPVPNASLTLVATSIFGPVVATQNATASGTYRFDGVFIGTFTLTARDPVTSRAASATGAIANDGQAVQVNLSLAPFGTIQGTVRRFDGTTTVPNATVTISGVASTKTDAQGQYQFPILPLGSYTIVVNDAATRGQGQAAATLVTNGQTVTADIQLLGQGSVVATVADANAAPVSGAQVTISAVNGNLFDNNLSGTTGADGTVVIDHVLAGQLTINASKSGLSAQPVSRSLAPGEVAQVTLTLQATASITGTVFAPDGQTPQASGHVTLVGVASATLATGGAFHFDGVKLGTYTLQAFDTLNHLRAIASVSLTSNGQIATQNLTFVGQGNVVGRVLNPNGTGAPSLSVQVVSADPTFGRTGFATTDAAGNYEVDNLALGAISVSTSDAVHGFLGQATGTLASNGQVLTINVSLQSNAFNFPITLFDANTFKFDLAADGSIQAGTNAVFGPTFAPRHGATLSVISGGVTTTFTGATIGTKEDQGREVATRQQNIAGLNITRKVFVPSTGYFARYLELVSNPTQAPITVDIQITSGLFLSAVPSQLGLISTSSGDAVLDVSNAATADRWAIVDDVDQDPFVVTGGNIPSLAFTFDGAGAPQRVGIATFSPNNGAGTGVMTYGWRSVTVPAGATVAFMHFVTQETSRAGATAAAQRLSQLPPEAVSGLASDEIAEILNFVVPADGSSPVPPLPALSGTASGTLYEFDGTTPTGAAATNNVSFKSADPLFGRTYSAKSDASGHYTLASKLSADATQIVIPIEPFSVSAKHPLTQIASASFAVAFNVGESVAVQNVTFTNTGWVTGHVRRQNGQTLTNGTVHAFGTLSNVIVNIAADGGFLVTGVPEGGQTLIATVNNPQGSALTATATTTAHVGQIATQDLFVPATGTVTGVVRTAAGAVASGVTVTLVSNGNGGVSRSTVTSGTGVYTLTDVPVGDYKVSALEPHSQAPTSVVLTVTQDQTTSQDFTLVGLGTLSVQVNYPSGAAANGVQVQLNVPSINQTFQAVATTDGAGHANVSNVPTLAVDVRAVNPVNTSVVVDAIAQLTSNGQVLPVALTLPAAGTITGHVTFATGTAAINGVVQLVINGVARQTTASASPDGRYTFSGVGTPPAVTVRAFNPNQTTQFKDATNLSLTVNNQTLTADITLPAQATLHVTGSPGLRVQVKSAFDTAFVQAGTMDGTGGLLVPNVPEGIVAVQLLDASSNIIGATTATVGSGDQGRTIEVPFSLISLPWTLFDGNGMITDVQRNGGLLTGSNAAFKAASEQMYVTVLPFSQSFIGPATSFGTFEDNQREIAVSQSGLDSNKVSVTRKIFVPSDGYFTRYLEIVTNITGVTQTATVGIASTSDNHVVVTSDGGTFFNSSDQWLVTDDDDGSQTSPPTRPALAFVVAGAGAPVGLSTGFFQARSNAEPGWEWTVTIPAGQTAILMHFLSQQPMQAGAIAAAQRLVQLPPEALAGLSASERAAIVNWIVPADGIGSVPPLPPRTGFFGGRVLMGDAQTLMPSTSVTFTSPNEPFFAAKTTTSNVNGVYSFNSVALDTFAVQAIDPITNVASPVVSANFPAGQTGTTQDVVFSNTGVVRGTVSQGSPVSGATVAVVAGSVTGSVTTQANGTYVISGLPAGSYTLEATKNNTHGVATVQVVNGQSITKNIALGAGSISGHIVFASGASAVGVTVRLQSQGNVFPATQTVSDASGNYLFSALVIGAPYVVQATHPTNPLAVVSSGTLVVVSNNQNVQANLTLPASATARVTVVDSDGVTPLHALVAIDRHDGQGFQQIGTTDTFGVISIPNVTGQFTVRAADGSGVLGTVDAVVAPADDGGITNVRLVAVGGTATISGTVFAVDAVTPVQDGTVTVTLSDETGATLATTTSANYSFSVRVTQGNSKAFSVMAEDPFNPGSSTGFTLGLSPGDALSGMNIDVNVPVVTGTVSFTDGSVVPFPNVVVTSSDGSGNSHAFFATRTDQSGGYGVPVLQLGAFDLTAQDPASGLTAVTSGSIDSQFDVVQEDVALPNLVALYGSVFDRNGTPVPDAQVVLATAGGVSRNVISDGGGFFSFDNVAPAPYRLVACGAAPPACGVAVGVADGSGTDIVVSPGQTLTGTVLDDSFAPSAGASVTVYSPNVMGMLDGIATTTDQTGRFVVDSVADTNVVVTAFAAGSSIGTVQHTVAGSDVTLYLSNGDASHFDYVAGSPSAALMHCDGSVDGGPGFTAFTTSTLQILAAAGGVPLDTFPCAPFTDLSTGFPAVDAGYRIGAGLDVSRQTYTSEDGRFTRFLEVLTNPTASEIVVRVRISGSLVSSAPVLTRSPAQTGNTYAVFDEGGAGLGLVFGQAGARAAASPHVENQRQVFSYEWTVTVPAGETVRLMHFVVQSRVGDAGGAQSAINVAAGLATLSNPEAFAGLTEDEKTTIVNFDIP